MTGPTRPAGLRAGGKRLWDYNVSTFGLDENQLVQLAEACRAKDKCDQLDRLLRGDMAVWTRLIDQVQQSDEDHRALVLKVDSAFGKATESATLMKQMIAAMRLPDEVSGKKPQHRGPRGAHAPDVPSGARQRLRSA